MLKNTMITTGFTVSELLRESQQKEARERGERGGKIINFPVRLGLRARVRVMVYM